MRMRRKRLALLLGIVVVAVVTAGLAAGVGDARQRKGYKTFLIPNVRWAGATQNGLGAKAAAKELGDTVTYSGPTAVSATAQVPFIDSAVRHGANAIIISSDDRNAIAPALKRAMAKGVKVISYDADTAPDNRTIYISPPSAKDIGFSQVKWLGSQIGYKGPIAILSTTPTAANQNTWIKYMERALKLPKYKGMQLVKIAYGNDDDTRSAQETQALLHAYPNLKGIISPTLVGVVAAARVLTRAHKCGKVALAGLGLPSQMRSYIKSGCAKVVFWDEFEFGYVAEYIAHNVVSGKLTGKAGQTFTAGRLGKRTVGLNQTVIFGKPLVFTKATVDKYNY
jgi:rhamnose transport system substrate-binding protein